LATVKLTRKKLLIGGVLCLLVIVLGVGTWIYTASRVENKEEPAALIPTGDVQIFAAEYARSGDVNRGMRLYNEQIALRTKNEDKLELLLGKANFSIDNKRYQDAVDAGQQADKLDTSLSATLALARAYEAQGDKKQAVKYYQRLLDKDGSGAGRDGDSWQHKIRELSQ